MKQFKHRVDIIAARNLKAKLQEMESKGWELAAANISRLGDGYILIFKRETVQIASDPSQGTEVPLG